jgi:hypothetical protein
MKVLQTQILIFEYILKEIWRFVVLAQLQVVIETAWNEFFLNLLREVRSIQGQFFEN